MQRRRLHEPFIYFVDECLGRHVVPDALRAAVDEGERIELRAQGTLDLDWIPDADAGGWVCLTKDRALRKRPNELAALLSGSFAVFLLGEASGKEHAARVVRALPIIRRVLRARDVPLIARIDDGDTVTILYAGGTRLDPPRKTKLKAGDQGR